MTPGTIGLPVDELSRYSASLLAFATVAKPEGTQVRFAMGRNIPESCNRIVREMTGDWVWWQADDHVYEPDTLLRLLRHNVDVVCPVMLMRQQPFWPVAISHENPDGSHAPLDFDRLPASGLVPVYACGSGGMLVRKHVFDRIGDNWFTPIPVPDGRLLSEDFSFCRRVRDAGFTIHLDLDTAVGHLSTIAVWPKRTETDGWVVHIDFNSGAKE